MYCKDSNSFTCSSIPNTIDANISVLTPKEDKDFIVRKIVLKQGGSMPNHNNQIQHQQFVLKGEARVIIGDEEFHAKQGDFLYIPAGVNHFYEACYDKDYEFLCMITTKEDSIEFID